MENHRSLAPRLATKSAPSRASILLKQGLKVGTVIKSIRLTGDAQEIDCRHEGIKGLVLRAEFVRKR